MKMSSWFSIFRVPPKITRIVLAAALASLVGVALHASLTGTIPLAPGLTVVPGNAGFPDNNVLVALQEVHVIPPAKDYEVAFKSVVEKEPSGSLDFYYGASNSALSSDSISRLTVSGFGPFQTSVGGISNFNCGGGTTLVAPTSADRDNNGNVVGFNFGPSAPFKVAPGTCGTTLISTNARSFTIGGASLIDGGATMVPAFLPTASTAPVYKYDFYFKGTTNVAASFLFNGFLRDWSPASVPIPGFTGFVYPTHYSLTPCDLTSNSSGELDCRGSFTGLNGNQINGVFYFVFNYGGFPRQLGSFTGSGYGRAGSSVVSFQDGQITQVAP